MGGLGRVGAISGSGHVGVAWAVCGDAGASAPPARVGVGGGAASAASSACSALAYACEPPPFQYSRHGSLPSGERIAVSHRPISACS
jgi:hypothetical protein